MFEWPIILRRTHKLLMRDADESKAALRKMMEREYSRAIEDSRKLHEAYLSFYIPDFKTTCEPYFEVAGGVSVCRDMFKYRDDRQVLAMFYHLGDIVKAHIIRELSKKVWGKDGMRERGWTGETST